MVDEDRAPGRFILTGSANFALLQSIGQSLAGRTALLELLPLSLEEIRRFEHPPVDLYDVIWRGSAPALHDRALQLEDWYPSYVSTYVERDARQVLNVGDLIAFQTFLRLCAGRVGQLLNLSALGADTGVTHATAGSWISVLEGGYIAWRLPPLHANLGKRLVKTPKLHFLVLRGFVWVAIPGFSMIPGFATRRQYLGWRPSRCAHRRFPAECVRAPALVPPETHAVRDWRLRQRHATLRDLCHHLARIRSMRMDHGITTCASI